MSASDDKKTPLYQSHVDLGAKMVPFAGYEMPVSYKGLREEHNNTRSNVGLFDVSHMGEFRVVGPQSLEFLQYVTTNDVAKLKKGEAQYSLLLNEKAGVVDDLIIYCVEENKNYFLCVNASNADKDFKWLTKLNTYDCELTNEGDEWSQIAVQGPKAFSLLEAIYGSAISKLKPFNFDNFEAEGISIIFAATGYTGEPGGEIFVKNNDAKKLWDLLLDKGQQYGVAPVGLGARDTLRMEMRYALHGQEISEERLIVGAGLGWVIKHQKGDFIGKQAYVNAKEKGAIEKLSCFKLKEPGIPRAGYKLINEAKEVIGEVTSGTLSPTLNVGIGIGYIAADQAVVGNEIFVQIRNKSVKAIVVKPPFIEK